MERTCPRCSHLNTSATGQEMEECPACGVIYSRVEKPTPEPAAPQKPSPSNEIKGTTIVLLAISVALAYYASREAESLRPKPDTPFTSAPRVCSTGDTQCLVETHSAAASTACTPLIESQLRYRHRWTNGFLEGPFNRGFDYEPGRTIIYHGNNLEAENGFGAWQKLSYFCVWNHVGKYVVKVGIHE